MHMVSLADMVHARWPWGARGQTVAIAWSAHEGLKSSGTLSNGEGAELS